MDKDVQEGYLFMILMITSVLVTLCYCLLSKYLLGSRRLHILSLLILTIGNAGFGPCDQLDGDAFLIVTSIITFVCFVGIIGAFMSSLSIIFRIYLGSVRIFVFIQGLSIFGIVSGGLLGSYLGDSMDFLISF
mmetsp:Transcript_37419/g.6719  ORF Transcript_37419/g.6719 Transcript_37419/m.6719 type:complete len:133 (+) Transcript_37419:83-481(+)